jgi:cobaltochelatase CobS
MTIETTIKDVLGGLPWQGPAGITITSETRPAVRTWLSRMGWKTEEYLSSSLDNLAIMYADREAYQARRNGAIRDVANHHATAPYAPRNENLLNYLRAKGIGTPKTDTATATATTPKVDATPKADAPKTAPRVDNVDSADSDDDTAELARILGRIAGKSGAAPLDEGRVIDLIREHSAAPVVHQVEIKRDGVTVKVKGAQHPKLPVLAKVLSARMTNGFVPNVWLYGPTASGKTHAAEQLAEAVGANFYMHGAMSMAHELTGFVDAAGNYHRTPFRDAFEHGGICLLDEVDSWDGQVTLALNAPLANGQCAFPDGMIKRHADCIIIAAGNTTGNGATADYVGRNRLDAAFLSRFAVKIEWDRDPAIEYAISGNDGWVRRVRAARQRAHAAGIKHLIDPRHSQAGAALIVAGIDADTVAGMTYLAGLTDAQRRTVEGV